MHGITVAVIVITAVFVTTYAATIAYVEGHQRGYQQRREAEAERAEL